MNRVVEPVPDSTLKVVPAVALPRLMLRALVVPRFSTGLPAVDVPLSRVTVPDVPLVTLPDCRASAPELPLVAPPAPEVTVTPPPTPVAEPAPAWIVIRPPALALEPPPAPELIVVVAPAVPVPVEEPAAETGKRRSDAVAPSCANAEDVAASQV